ncbi:MAG: thioredoxin [Clostridia bacterium]|nr:thioredoxin [Clostridia bacterium]
MSRIALAAVGVVLVVVGIFNGGMADVLEKAVQICTQCIGLG